MQTASTRVIGPAAGKAGFLGSIGVRFMIDGENTDGGFALVEHPMSAHALAAPLHRHLREDEYSYVLEGRMGAQLGDDVVFAEAGDLVFQAAEPVAHVLERRRRALQNPRDHFARRIRALLRRAHRPRRRRPGRARAAR